MPVIYHYMIIVEMGVQLIINAVYAQFSVVPSVRCVISNISLFQDLLPMSSEQRWTIKLSLMRKFIQ